MPSASKAAGSGPGARRASARAPAGRAGSAKIDRASRCASAPAARRPGRSPAGRDRLRRAGPSRAGASCSGRTGLRGRSPARRSRSATHARDRRPRARSRPVRRPGCRSTSSRWCRRAARAPARSARPRCPGAAAHGEVRGVVVQDDRGHALRPLGEDALDDDAVSSRRPRRVRRQHASPWRKCASVRVPSAIRRWPRPRARARPPPRAALLVEALAQVRVGPPDAVVVGALLGDASWPRAGHARPRRSHRTRSASRQAVERMPFEGPRARPRAISSRALAGRARPLGRGAQT